MSKISKPCRSASYSHVWRWVADHGTVEIGYCGQTRSFIRILDEGGIVWKGTRSYPTIDAALADAEAGLARWMRDELGISDAALLKQFKTRRGISTVPFMMKALVDLL